MISARTIVLAALLSVVASTGEAQQRGGGCQMNGGVGGNRVRGVFPNTQYDGRFTFARVFYATGFNNRGGGGGDPPWHHDYNRAETHFTKLLVNLTKIKAHTAESNVLSLDDPEFFKFPIAYLSEPGHWFPSDAEIVSLRKYLTKGGFLIFDDFVMEDVPNLQTQMSKVLPGMKLIELDTNYPVFDSFYRVKSLDFYHPYYCVKSMFYGIFEDNDPKKRLIAVVNANNDIGEAWEWSDQGVFAIDVSNEAYKLGINYIIYAMTR